MRARVLVLAAIATLLSHAPAHAIRIAYYRVGTAVVAPGSLEDPGTYGLGYGFNAGVTAPFMHRLGITLDLSHDRVRWENGSEVTATTVKLDRKDLSVSTALLGLDVAFQRGNEARPLLSIGFGAARVSPGDAEITDMLTGTRTTAPSESKTVFAFSGSAGVRMKLPAFHSAVRAQIGFLGLTRDKFAYLVPLRFQYEF